MLEMTATFSVVSAAETAKFNGLQTDKISSQRLRLRRTLVSSLLVKGHVSESHKTMVDLLRL